MHKSLGRAVAALFIIMLIPALIKAVMLSPAARPADGNLIFLNGTWEKTADIADGDAYCEYTCSIPSLGDKELVLSIEAFWSSFQVLLNGREIASFTDEYREYGSVRHWIEIPKDRAEGILSIRSDSDNLYLQQVVKGKTYIGSCSAVFTEFFYENLFALIFACISVILSIIIFISNISLKKYASDSDITGNLYLCIFILLVGVWVVTDSRILQIFTDRVAAVVLISFLSFIAMPIFFICFVQRLLTRRSKLLKLMNLLFLMNMALFLIIYLFRLLAMYKVLFLQHILIFVSVTYSIIKCILDIKQYGNKDIKPVVIGIGCLSFCSIAAIVCFWINPSMEYSVLYIIGIILFVLCLVYIANKRMQQHMERSINAKIYKELAYTDGMTQMYNRTAFQTVQNDESVNADRAVVMFDINYLKKTNDKYGHHIGDRLIAEAARCILNIFDNVGKCYRVGGDEFVAVLDGLSNKEIESRLGLLEERLKKTDCGKNISVGLTYGYAMQNGRQLTNDELFKEADANMYINKHGE